MIDHGAGAEDKLLMYLVILFHRAWFSSCFNHVLMWSFPLSASWINLLPFFPCFSKCLHIYIFSVPLNKTFMGKHSKCRYLCLDLLLYASTGIHHGPLQEVHVETCFIKVTCFFSGLRGLLRSKRSFINL